MAAIVADCLQVSIKGTHAPRNWANVMHFQELGASPPDPAAAAQLVLDIYCDNLLPYMSSFTHVDSADYADLSSLSGVSGSVTPTGGTQAGGGSGTSQPSSVAVLLTWSALGTRSQRNGRSYMVGVPEDQTTSDGLLVSGAITNWTGAIDNFLDDLQSADLGLVVLSKSGPSAGDVRTVTGGIVQPLLATQRRRLRK